MSDFPWGGYSRWQEPPDEPEAREFKISAVNALSPNLGWKCELDRLNTKATWEVRVVEPGHHGAWIYFVCDECKESVLSIHESKMEALWKDQ